MYDIVFDTDGDGFITGDDLTAMGQRISDEFGVPDGARRKAIGPEPRSSAMPGTSPRWRAVP